jgi:hypothetical protein
VNWRLSLPAVQSTPSHRREVGLSAERACGIPLVWSNYKPVWFIDVNGKVVHFRTMTKTDAQMKIRLPEDLKLRIEQSAKEGGRSLNSEIVRRLEGSLSPSCSVDVKETYSRSEVEEMFNVMNDRITKLEDVISKILNKL